MAREAADHLLAVDLHSPTRERPVMMTMAMLRQLVQRRALTLVGFHHPSSSDVGLVPSPTGSEADLVRVGDFAVPSYALPVEPSGRQCVSC